MATGMDARRCMIRGAPICSHGEFDGTVMLRQTSFTYIRTYDTRSEDFFASGQV